VNGFLIAGVDKTSAEFQKITILANRLKVTIPQLSLTWLLYQSDYIISIAGTSSEKHLLENMRASQINLSNIELRY